MGFLNGRVRERAHTMQFAEIPVHISTTLRDLLVRRTAVVVEGR